MADHAEKTDPPGLRLTPRLLIVGAITLAGWLWFYFQGEPLDAPATVVLMVAALLVVELIRVVPYARISRALTSKRQRHEQDKRRRHAQGR
jgi:hypothetical protein